MCNLIKQEHLNDLMCEFVVKKFTKNNFYCNFFEYVCMRGVITSEEKINDNNSYVSIKFYFELQHKSILIPFCRKLKEYHMNPYEYMRNGSLDEVKKYADFVYKSIQSNDEIKKLCVKPIYYNTLFY